MSLPNPAELISQMAIRLKAHLQHRAISEPRFIGIRTGGVWVAQALLQGAGQRLARWARWTCRSTAMTSARTACTRKCARRALPFEIEGQHLVLIDDVLMSGRTIRAAMNELFDYGRPASITLVCLLDLEAGELPISPDVVGATLSLSAQQRVKLSGPTPLELELQDLAL
jgi:pyrimidine operon attenuation protein / uracil phosphoribosyltransferase